MIRPRKLFVAPVLMVLVGLPSVAHADCDKAEKVRLGGEFKKLAQRNAWAGVERTYEALLGTKCELSFDEHQLGAESARYLGKTYEMYERLDAAKQIDPQPEVVESLKGLELNYGRVDIRGDARRRPELVREAMPFAPDQRKSIEYAITYMTETGSFYGMLPVGDYVVGGIPFTVQPGGEFMIVQVGKVKAPKGGSGGSGGSGGGQKPESEGAINWAGLVATVGPNFMMTPEPKDPFFYQSGQYIGETQSTPSDIFASGAALMVGGELGLTYKAPEMGVAFLVGYAGGFGNDTLHQISGWAPVVIRPGELRFAVGPSYSFIGGRGTGVASWYDVGQDPQSEPVEGIRYQGLSYGGGLTGSVGMGLFDVGDSMRGFVELGGGWTTDTTRSFTGFGLRVGVVPTVPRFKG